MLTRIQKHIVEILKPTKSSQVFIAGGCALNRNTVRISEDIDIFGKTDDAITSIAHKDLAILKKNNFSIDIHKDLPGWVEGEISLDGEKTLVQWIWDDEFHFLPIQEDSEFGYALHPCDLAVNKITAAFGRRKARDYVDLALIDQTYAPLGIFIWAAPGKIRRAHLTPLEIIEEIRRRFSAHPQELYQNITMTNGADPLELIATLDDVLDRATVYVEAFAPADYYGCLFIDKNGKPILATDESIKSGSVKPIKASQQGLWPRFDEQPWVKPDVTTGYSNP